MAEDDITAVVCEAYKKVLDLQDIDIEKPEKIDEATPIYGNNGYLDSLGLVNLVVALEEIIQERFNISISLVDEKAMSQTNSPFSNVKSTVLYIKELLKEKSL